MFFRHNTTCEMCLNVQNIYTTIFFSTFGQKLRINVTPWEKLKSQIINSSSFSPKRDTQPRFEPNSNQERSIQNKISYWKLGVPMIHTCLIISSLLSLSQLSLSPVMSVNNWRCQTIGSKKGGWWSRISAFTAHPWVSRIFTEEDLTHLATKRSTDPLSKNMYFLLD